MPVAWYIAPYSTRQRRGRPVRYVDIDQFTGQFRAAGGGWSETEILGDRAIVKVRGPLDLLGTIEAEYYRLPADSPPDSLALLTNGQVLALDDQLLAAGYGRAEITGILGTDLRARTLGDALAFLARRRQKPRYDEQAGVIVLDGPDQTPLDYRAVNGRVLSDAQYTVMLAMVDSYVALADQNGHVIVTESEPLRGHILAEAARRGYGLDKISPGTFPTTGLLDTFDGSGALSASWTADIFNLSELPGVRVSGRLEIDTDVVASQFWNAATFGADSESYVTDIQGIADCLIEVYARLQSPGTSGVDGYNSAYSHADSEAYLNRVDNAALTQLGAAISASRSNGDGLGLECISSTHTLYAHNGSSWSSLGNRTDSTYTSSGNIGCYMGDEVGEDVSVTAFGGGTVVAGGDPEGSLLGGKLIRGGLLKYGVLVGR